MEVLRLYKILFTILICTALISCNSSTKQKTNKAPAKKFRYVICTGMTHDDDNSMIRLLHYANEIDIEAIIITDQGPETQRIDDWPNKLWNRAQEIYNTYEKVVDNLKLHDPNFPNADYFRKITKQGIGTAQRLTGSTDNGQEKFWNYDGERLTPRRILADGNNFWKYIGAIDVEKIHKLSGPLGDLYDEGGEGDTPAFLNLISMNRGLSEITQPEFGGTTMNQTLMKEQ